MSQDQTCNLSSAAPLAKTAGWLLGLLLMISTRCWERSRPSTACWKSSTKNKNRGGNEEVCVCAQTSVYLSETAFVFDLAHFFFLTKHVFDICMLKRLNLPLWWKFPKCYAMFQSLSSAVFQAVNRSSRLLPTFHSETRAETMVWVNLSH